MKYILFFVCMMCIIIGGMGSFLAFTVKGGEGIALKLFCVFILGILGGLMSAFMED